MPNTLDDNTGKRQAVLVTFVWPTSAGAYGAAAGYAATNADVIAGGHRWQAVPAMTVTISEMVPAMTVTISEMAGGVSDHPATITMPELPPLDRILEDGIHQPVQCEIQEASLDDPTARRTVFFGEVYSVTRAPLLNAGVCRVMVVTPKHRLGIPLGIITEAYCSWTFGDKNCKIDKASLRETGVIDSVDRNLLSISGLTTTGGRYWHRGNAMIDGLEIMIREYDAGTNFYLSELPPAHWLGREVLLTPGCDKTVEVCRNRWNNEAEFGGLGIAMPAYNPLVETQ